ncbi:hypothetical protein ACFLZV_03435 [Candidatus Margulisiibacteriota bacterium]
MECILGVIEWINSQGAILGVLGVLLGVLLGAFFTRKSNKEDLMKKNISRIFEKIQSDINVFINESYKTEFDNARARELELILLLDQKDLRMYISDEKYKKVHEKVIFIIHCFEEASKTKKYDPHSYRTKAFKAQDELINLFNEINNN